MSDGGFNHIGPKWKLHQQKKWTHRIMSTPDKVPTKKLGKNLRHEKDTL